MLGFDSATQAKAMQSPVGYMSQHFTLYNDLTAVENIRFYGRVYGLSDASLRERRPRSSTWPGWRGAKTRSPATLPAAGSSAWRWAAPSCTGPQVVFLDEPTAGVDPISRREFWELIYAMAKAGRHGAGDHPLHGRGRAVPADRVHQPGAAGGARHARPAQSRPRCAAQVLEISASEPRPGAARR